MASKSKNPEAIKKMNSMTNIAKKLIPYMNFVYNNEESIYNVGYVISEKGREMAGMISNRPPSP